MVIGVKSIPTGIPNVRCSEEANFIQCKIAILWYKIALWYNSSIVILGLGHSVARLLCSTLPVWSTLHCAGLLPSALVRHLQCFNSAREIQSLVFSGKCTLWAREELDYIDRSPYPWSLVGLSTCKWSLQILTVWLVQTALFWLVRINHSDWSELCSSDWMWKASVLLVEIDFRNSLLRTGSDGRNTVQAVSWLQKQSVQRQLFREMQFVWEVPGQK